MCVCVFAGTCDCVYMCWLVVHVYMYVYVCLHINVHICAFSASKYGADVHSWMCMFMCVCFWKELWWHLASLDHPYWICFTCSCIYHFVCVHVCHSAHVEVSFFLPPCVSGEWTSPVPSPDDPAHQCANICTYGGHFHSRHHTHLRWAYEACVSLLSAPLMGTPAYTPIGLRWLVSLSRQYVYLCSLRYIQCFSSLVVEWLVPWSICLALEETVKLLSKTTRPFYIPAQIYSGDYK